MGGVSASACSGVTIGCAGTIIACARSWLDAMTKQAGHAHKLRLGAIGLESQVKTRYDKMERVKKEIVDVLLVPDVDVFKAAIIPEIKKLVGVLLTTAGEQQAE